MINLLSIRCGLAFAPYLAESASEFLSEGVVASRVVRQAGSSLIIRSDSEVALRYQGRECLLGTEDVRHYLATVVFRTEAYDVLRLSDEVVTSTVGRDILLSHPQSELWLERAVVAEMLSAFKSEALPAGQAIPGFPHWLSISSGGGRLLLSDERTGRWVLLGADHMAELERRLQPQEEFAEQQNGRVPPTIAVKGLTVHLQSALKLAETLEEFASTGNVIHFEECTPTYSLTAGNATEGIELKDSDMRVALTAREARKWVGIVRCELNRLNVRQVERGRIRTVFADLEDGQWVLQWGDELFVPRGATLTINHPRSEGSRSRGLLVKQSGGFRLLLNHATGACVALEDSEVSHLRC
jgi:hypothetical protein